MKKIISFFGLFAVLGVGIGDARGVAMSPQVQRLLQEKQDKIAQLEKCEGKKQGWMIAGISTIGLTAVGVGINVAQAVKSNKLSGQIDTAKGELDEQKTILSGLNAQIEQKQRENEENHCCDKIRKDRCCDCAIYVINGRCPDSDDWQIDEEYDYGKYKLGCDQVEFTFVLNTGYEHVLAELNAACKNVTGKDMEKTEKGAFVKYECKNYKVMANCGKSNNDDEDFPTTVTCDDKDKVFTCAVTPQEMERCRKLGTICEQTLGGKWESVENLLPNGERVIGASSFKCVNMKNCDDKDGPQPEVKDEREIGKPCLKKDLPDGATGGIYWEKSGAYQCLYQGKHVPCSCKVTTCKDKLVVKDYERCVEPTKQEETKGRVIGKACIEEDINKLKSYGWLEGTYIRVGESVKTTLGVRCETKEGAGDNVNCSCRADKCDEANQFEKNSSGGCVKKKEECRKGQVRVDGKGDCKKIDYRISESCKCAKDASKQCTLSVSDGGDLVCDVNGEGVMCKCADCPTGETFDAEKGGCINPKQKITGPERVLNTPCVQEDLQYPAKEGTYVLGGSLLCKGLPSVGAATHTCSCEITGCEQGYHVSSKGNKCDDNCPASNQTWSVEKGECVDIKQKVDNPKRIGLPEK